MVYDKSISGLCQQLAAAKFNEIKNVASRLVAAAQSFDLNNSQNLGINFRMQQIQRDAQNPVEHTDQTILGAPWADDEKSPLEKGERWHSGRRATNTGLKYTFDQAGRPVNPYMNTGLNGRGVLGQFGPNHAVDNGLIEIKPDENGEMALYALCILRKYDNDAPAFSGGFAEYNRAPNGEYIFDRAAAVNTQAKELFEEMISGSVDLLPEYAAKLSTEINAEYARRMQGRAGQPLSAHQRVEIAAQVETELKYQQVEDKDPDFLKRLHEVVAKGRECYAGPVLCDNRSTNNAWIETRLSWLIMDDQSWGYIKGAKPRFNYQFTAGDDASGVVSCKITPEFIRDAYASHGAFFAFMCASYMLDAEEKGETLSPSIIKQMKWIVDGLEGGQPAYKQAPIVP